MKDSAYFVLRGDKVACRYVFPGDLWLVDIDKGQISQVVQNIIINAAHAMPGGGIIDVACENMASPAALGKVLQPEGKYVKMTITDTGIGIPANVIDNIFAPYFSTKQQGSRLGLAITHSIVSKHGGHIPVKSTPEIGTTFTVYLPASARSFGTGTTTQKEDPSVPNVKILIMDDDEQIREMTQAMLNQRGYEVVLAADGRGAVRIYQEYGFCGALVKPFRITDLLGVVSQVLSEPESQG